MVSCKILNFPNLADNILNFPNPAGKILNFPNPADKILNFPILQQDLEFSNLAGHE